MKSKLKSQYIRNKQFFKLIWKRRVIFRYYKTQLWSKKYPTILSTFIYYLLRYCSIVQTKAYFEKKKFLLLLLFNGWMQKRE